MSRANLSTKADLVNSALSKMAISGITAPPQATDYVTLLSRLEGMMYEFEQGRGICANYNFTDQPNTADYHGMDFGLFEPVSSILALKTLQDYAIPPNPTLLAAASAGVTSLSNQTFEIRETQYPRRQARGSGNTLRYNRWQRFYRKPDRVPLGCDSFILDNRAINDYSESYLGYLRPDEDITAFTITHTGGLKVISSSHTNTLIRYRLEGLNPSIDNGLEQVRLSLTTSTGRKDERLINFEVLPVTLEPERFNPTTP